MDIVGKILPIFQVLTADSLQERCLKACTQNSNESFHSMIWAKCSKETNISKQYIEAAVLQAILDFNIGTHTCMKEFQENSSLLSSSSSWSFLQAKRKDARRYRKSIVKASAKYELYEKKIHLPKLKLCEEQKSKEALYYETGAF